MKSLLCNITIMFVICCSGYAQQSYAATPASLSGSTNSQFACSPPYLSLAAKPNIHFVLDVTGSMGDHPYVTASKVYAPTSNYYGLFKNNMYYSYNSTAGQWQEQTSCTNTDLIGSPGCVSGNLLSYITTNKVDIVRRVLTGGRTLSTDSTVYEHEQGSNTGSITGAGEPTSSCSFDTSTAGLVTIATGSGGTVTTTIKSSNVSKISVTKNAFTFTRTDTGSFLTDGWLPGMTFTTTGFTNNGTWTIAAGGVTKTVITVTTSTGSATESKTATLTGPTTTTTTTQCQVLLKTTNQPMTVNATTKQFTRTDSGSFITDGWQAGMQFDAVGFSNSGNNATWTIATGGVAAKTITVTSSSGMTTNATAATASFSQRLTANVHVQSSTSTTNGLIQGLYPGKADIEVSFFSTSGTIGVDYTGGTVANSNTVKNQSLSNYINGINGTVPGGSTNTGPAMTAAMKFFQQDSTISATAPSSGTALINKGVGDSDPFYEPPASGTATAANSTAASCRKAFVILISDGQWNSPDTSSASDPVWPAFTMHRRDGTYDLRPDLAGKQSVTVYTVYAFGGSDVAGRNAMITTAIFGGFDDIDNNTTPYPFTTTSSPFKTLSITSGYNTSLETTKVSFPLAECNPDGTWNAGCAEWDKSPGPTTDNPTQKHTGLPYNFFEADDGDALYTALTNTVNDILGRVASSTAASILGNNDNAGASLVQAMFYPEKQFDGTIKASWIGEVQAFWYYLDPKLQNVTIREDTVADQKLKLSEDKIAQFTFDGTYTKVNLYSDANGDGVIDNPTTPDSTVDIEAVNTLWHAGRTLWSRAASDRTIYVNDPTVTTVAGSRILFQESSSTSTALATKLQPYLDVSTATGAVPTATDVINYTRGTDISTSYSVRPRAIQISTTTNTWKLGDVINSTPKIASEVRINSYNLSAPAGYSDTSYDKYIKSKDYNWRGMAYVGSNDGMLHAFKTGSNFTGSTQGYVAEIKNADGTASTDLGKEMWAFIPKNALPYLQYMMLPGYQHLYSVDATPLLVDASINKTNSYKSDGTSITTTCSDTAYNVCPLRTTVDSSGQLNYSTTTNGGGTSWRTILIEGMGLGGASRDTSSTCTNCVKTPITGLGYSSFFALDVTDPLTEIPTSSTTTNPYPKLLWEFSDPRLGYTTVTPAVMRIKDTNDTAASPRNGRWVALFASGPTGPITSSTLSFEGRSDMPLTLFVVDLKTGALLRTFNNRTCADAVNSFDTNCASIHTQVTSMPDSAFAGSLSGSTIDADKFDTTKPGAYSDDAVFIGYTRNSTATPTVWDKGGVLRLLTYNEFSPANWSVSPVIDGIGPVTSAVTKLQDQTKHKLWLYFGTGRYFVKGDDATNVQSLFGIIEPCFGNSGTADTFNGSKTSPCTTTLVASSSGTSGASGTNLINQTSSVGAVASTDKGWFINLPGASGTGYPERVITDPVASTTGIITFTSFTPSTDVCSYGGTTAVWAVKYDTGGSGASGLQGQILIQLSTGAFQQIDVSSAFTNSLGRETQHFSGVPPRNPPASTTNSNHTPSKRILHMQER